MNNKHYLVTGILSMVIGWATNVFALDDTLLAKAEADECYNGIGMPYVPLASGGSCASDETPKVNEAYVWGLAKAGDDLWFGTVANTHCLVLGTFLGSTTSNENNSWVCEMEDSQYKFWLADKFSNPAFLAIPPALGDWRIPKIYVYNVITETLDDKTPLSPLVAQTVGFRSAGTSGEVMFLAGPSLRPGGGVIVFAYDTVTGDFIEGVKLAEYTNIRKWIEVGGKLYTAVQASDDTGKVLKWIGDKTDPFQFEIVGELPSEGAELALHENRLFITTWPRLPVVPAGLYVSPDIPVGGLTNADSLSWSNKWLATDYEPDPVIAMTYGGGALASFDGDLYWGTMHVPGTSAAAAELVYDLSGDNPLNVIASTLRAISIFRLRNFDTSAPEVQEVLYGKQYVPVYDPAAQAFTYRKDADHMTGMGPPLWGKSGFGNALNNYTWTMAVFDNRLYIGTMDFTYLVKAGIISSDPILGPITWAEKYEHEPREGADIWSIGSSDGPAVPEFLNGVGNVLNYGIRTMVATSDHLYLGTANPMNLEPEGGWELIRLTPSASGGGGGGGGGLCSLGPKTASAWMAGDLWLLLAFISGLGLWGTRRRNDAVK